MKGFTTSHFDRKLEGFVKMHPNLSARVSRIITDILRDPFAPHLKTHKLSGELKENYSAKIDYENRIVFTVNPNEICFLDIGPHDEVY